MRDPLTQDERERYERLSEMLDTFAELSHKINNPLTSLMGRAQLLANRAGDDPYVRCSCEAIEESSRRLAAYVRELAAVVREAREQAVETVDA